MHIIIAFISALGGLVWALYWLNNSGVNLNSFNPFYWARRREWQKRLGTKAIHQLTNPMEAAAALVVATAEIEGSVARDTKADILTLFCEEFAIDRAKANEMYGSSAYLLKELANIPAEVKMILSPSLDKFEQRHKETLIDMMTKVSEMEDQRSQAQQALLDAVRAELQQTQHQAQW